MTGVRTRAVGRAGIALLGVVLASCVELPKAPPPSPAELPAACRPSATPASGRLFAIDREASVLRIHAYRDGRLARLGHNHVITSRDLWGYGVLADPLTASRFVLCVPVATLVVDDPSERATAGPGFEGDLGEAAAAGTRRNMLGEGQLDARHHPYLLVSGRISGGIPPEVFVDLVMEVRGAHYSLPATASLAVGDGAVTARGVLKVRQSQLGIERYSALFGDLLVRDELEIGFDLRATSALP